MATDNLTTHPDFAPKPTANRFIDIEGHIYGRLTVLGYAGRWKKHSYWHCRCECGTIVCVKANLMRRGATRSCGCLWGETICNFKHGLTGTPEHRAYGAAKNRCNNPNNGKYANYGGRGIEFRFNDFDEFLACLGVRPSLKHSLNRIDNDGHYEAGNVEWALPYAQQRNQTRNIHITSDNKTLVLRDWSAELGGVKELVSVRRRRGWCDACATTLKKGMRCPHRSKA